jgi:hypothetical protein
MIKNFKDFLFESETDYAWLGKPFIEFIEETDSHIKKETGELLSFLTTPRWKVNAFTKGEKEFGVQTSGSSSLIQLIEFKKKPDTWMLDNILENEWFGVGLSPKDEFMAEMLSVYYKLSGFKFIPYTFYRSGDFSWRKIDKESADFLKKEIGEDYYLAIIALREGRIPTKLSAKKIAEELTDKMKNFPVLNLEPYKTKITSNKYGI